MLLLCIVTHSISNRKHRKKAYHSLYKKSKNLNARQQVVAPPTSTNGNFDLMQENEKLIDNSLYRRDDVDVFNQFNNDAPILWNGDMKQEKHGTAGTANAVSRGQVSKHGAKKDGGIGEIDEGDFPSTALQNPNIFGGFPENDIWGNFELPASETLDKLKSSLKVNHHKPNYGAEDGSDSISELYGYEHHALPEYDILETPQFHETPRGQKLLQDIASSNGGGCPGMGSCPPIAAKIACQNIQTTCNDKGESSQAIDYESPCAAKILSLFGCKVNEKVDAPVEPLQHTSLSNSPKEEAKPETKLEDQPELKLEAKIDTKLEAKPDVKIEAKPETKIDVKVESKPESKLNPKEDSKPEAKLEPKEDSKTEAKLEGKEDSKPEAKLEPKEDSKPEAKLEHKIEAKVELKPESDKEGNQHHEQQALSSETLFKSPNLEISLDNEKEQKTENSVAKLLSALRNSPSFQKTPVKSFSDDSANNEQSQEVLDGVGLKNDDESLTLGLMQDIGNDLQKTLTEKFDSNNDKNTTLPLNKKEGGETDSTITASITEKLPTVNDVTNDNKELKSYFQFVSSEPSKQQQKETQQAEGKEISLDDKLGLNQIVTMERKFFREKKYSKLKIHETKELKEPQVTNDIPYS